MANERWQQQQGDLVPAVLRYPGAQQQQQQQEGEQDVDEDYAYDEDEESEDEVDVGEIAGMLMTPMTPMTGTSARTAYGGVPMTPIESILAMMMSPGSTDVISWSIPRNIR